MKNPAIKLILLLLATNIVCLSAQNRQDSPDKNSQSGSSYWRPSGDLFLNFYPVSKKPAFIRGQIPYQHWSAGGHLKLEYSKKIELDLLTTITGATPFDNPERFEYNIIAKLNATRMFSVLWGLDASYNINQEPVADPTGRIPNTGLSQMFIGAQLTKQRSGNWHVKNEVYFTKNIRGNIPIFNNDFRGPYVGWRFGNNFTTIPPFDGGRWKFTLDSCLERNSRGFLGNLAAVGATAILERQFGRHIMWQNGAMIRHNLGKRPDHLGPSLPSGRPPIGLAPIGRDVFIVWLGPRFTF